MEMTWADKMQERGRKEGRREGVEVSQRVLLKLLTQRFGRAPQEVRQRVTSLKDLATLESLIDRVFSSLTLEELGLQSSEIDVEK